MIIMIVSKEYSEYHSFKKIQFPYYSLSANDKNFTWIDPKNIDSARSLQSGNVYIHLSGELPEWFVKRFNKISINKSKLLEL